MKCQVIKVAIHFMLIRSGHLRRMREGEMTEKV